MMVSNYPKNKQDNENNLVVGGGRELGGGDERHAHYIRQMPVVYYGHLHLVYLTFK